MKATAAEKKGEKKGISMCESGSVDAKGMCPLSFGMSGGVWVTQMLS